MAAKERLKARNLPTVFAVARVFPPVEARLRLHEGVRVLAELLAHFRMRLQILLQGWLVLDPLAVFYVDGIPSQLLLALLMAFSGLVPPCQFPSVPFAVCVPHPLPDGLFLRYAF